MAKNATDERRLDVIFGAKALAQYIFIDEAKWKAGLKGELGLFKMHGQICGRPSTMDQRVAALEADTND